MVSVKTTTPIPLTLLTLIPGKARGMVVSEVMSGKAEGTRRAVKVSVKIGRKTHVGWASRQWFEFDSIYAARKQLYRGR